MPIDEKRVDQIASYKHDFYEDMRPHEGKGLRCDFHLSSNVKCGLPPEVHPTSFPRNIIEKAMQEREQDAEAVRTQRPPFAAESEFQLWRDEFHNALSGVAATLYNTPLRAQPAEIAVHFVACAELLADAAVAKIKERRVKANET